MTRPQPALSMAGKHSWVRRKAVPQLERQVVSNSSIVTSEAERRRDLERVVPALLNRTAGAPRVDVTAWWRVRTWKWFSLGAWVIVRQ